MNEKHLSPFIHLIGLFFLTLFLFLSAIACAEKPVRSLIELRHANVVVQKFDLSCGAAALTSLLNFQFGNNLLEKDVAIGLMHRDEYVEDPTLIQQREGFSLLD